MNDLTIDNGVITSAGPFEGEPSYSPYFANLLTMSLYDNNYGHTFTFFLSPSERRTFPELANASFVMLSEDMNGNIYASHS